MELAQQGGEQQIVVLGQFEGVEIAARPSDQSFCLTDICKGGGKEWSNYYKNQSTQEFLEKVSLTLRIPRVNLVEVREGRYGGSWGPRLVALDVARWCSVDLHLQIMQWTDEILTTGSVSICKEHTEAKQTGLGVAEKPAGDRLARYTRWRQKGTPCRNPVGKLGVRTAHRQPARR